MTHDPLTCVASPPIKRSEQSLQRPEGEGEEHDAAGHAHEERQHHVQQVARHQEGHGNAQGAPAAAQAQGGGDQGE